MIPCDEMSREGSCRETEIDQWLSGAEERKEFRVSANHMRSLFSDDKNIRELVKIVQQLCEFPKKQMNYTFFKFFYCYSITVVCLFAPSLHPTPAKTPSLPHLHPLP